VDVHAGWRLAAIGQGSSAWAEALLSRPVPGPAPERPPGAWPRDHQLTEVLAPAARTARAAALLASAPGNLAAIAEVVGCPGPWPDSVADAVIDALRRAVTVAAKSAASADWSGWREKLAVVAGRGLPVTSQNDYAAALARLAETDHCPPHWSAALRHAARTVALRRAFLEEIR
jgi:hypothetical protein